MNVPARPGCSLDLQPRAENDRPLHPRTVFWHRRGQPSQYPSVHWDNALRGRRAGRHGPLLWEIWLRDANARQVDAHLAPDVAIDHLLAPFTPEKNAALMVRILNEVVCKSIDSKHKITNNASEFLRLINWYKVSTLGNHM